MVGVNGLRSHVARYHCLDWPAKWLCEVCGWQERSWEPANLKRHGETQHAKALGFKHASKWDDEQLKAFPIRLEVCFPKADRDGARKPSKKKECSSSSKEGSSSKTKPPNPPPSRPSREEALIETWKARKYFEKVNSLDGERFQERMKSFEASLGIAAVSWGKKPAYFNKKDAQDGYRVASQLLVKLATLAVEDPEPSEREEAWGRLQQAKKNIRYAVNEREYSLWNCDFQREDLLTLNRFATGAVEEILEMKVARPNAAS